MNENSTSSPCLKYTWKIRLLEYVKLPGYRFSYRDRDEKRVGGVGVYTKDCKTYKIGKDDDSFEHFGN